MHQVLLIDEILQQVFEFCLECGQDTLSQVARCCKAWKDPALDKLWRRLSSVRPLLLLVPGITCIGGIYVPQRQISTPEFRIFHSYAHRVKHITHRHHVEIHPLVLSLLTRASSADDSIPNSGVLPSLTTVYLTTAGCDALHTSLSLSTKLRHLDLDLGFKTRNSQSSNTNNTAVCEYLEQVVRVAPGIEQISLRGLASERLNRTISSMTKLRVLCLRIGISLVADTLTAISTFPLLSELEIHAGHIEVNNVITIPPSHRDPDSPTFSSLRKLHVRAHTLVVELLLQNLQPDTLRILRIEAETPAQFPISWNSIFNLIDIKGSNTIQDLTIEHHIDIDDLDLDSHNTTASIDTDTDANNNTKASDHRTNNHLTLNILRPLSRLRYLRRFILDTSLPPTLCDRDIEHMAMWWPDLEHLDLSLPTLECSNCKWNPVITIASLQVFANTSPRLTSLILPLAIPHLSASIAVPVTSSSQGTLRRLTIGSTSPPEAVLMAQYLNSLFPSLQEVDGALEHEEDWKNVRSVLLKLQLERKMVSAS